MSDLNDAAPVPDKPAPIRANRFSPRASLSKVALLGGVLVAGVALGAGGLAAASAQTPGWLMGGGPGWHDGSRLERIQGFTRRALDGVGATSDQQAKIHDIIAATYGDLAPSREDRQALRKAAIDLLKAPTIDAAAIEKLRADRMAALDAKSKELTKALVDIAGTLTPEQRVKLAERAERFADRRGGDRPWRHHGGPRGMMGGPGMDHGPGPGPGPGPGGDRDEE